MVATWLALGIGVVAGSRAMLAPTAVSWAASKGWLPVPEKRLRFLAHPLAPRVLTALALGELVGDKLPATPSRTNPAPFVARVLTGALSGYVIGDASGERIGGFVAGAIGAAVGTLGLRTVRGSLARAFGQDWPAALIEDSSAIVGGLLIARRVRAEHDNAPLRWVRRLVGAGAR